MSAQLYADAVLHHADLEFPSIADDFDPEIWRLLRNYKVNPLAAAETVLNRVKHLLGLAKQVEHLDSAFYDDWSLIREDARAIDILDRIGALNTPPPKHAYSVLKQKIKQKTDQGEEEFDYAKKPFAYAVIAFDTFEKRGKSLPVQEGLHFLSSKSKITGAEPFTWLRKFQLELQEPTTLVNPELLTETVSLPAKTRFVTVFRERGLAPASAQETGTHLPKWAQDRLADAIQTGIVKALGLDEGDYDAIAIMFRGSEWTGTVPRTGEYPVEVRDSRLQIDPEAPCPTLEEFEQETTSRTLGPRLEPPPFNTYHELVTIALEAEDHDKRGLSEVIESTEVVAAKTFGVAQKGGKVRRIFWPEIINQYATASERMLLLGIRGVMAMTAAAAADIGQEKHAAATSILQSKADLFRQVVKQVEERKRLKDSGLPLDTLPPSRRKAPLGQPLRTGCTSPTQRGTGIIPIIFLRDFKGAFYQLFVRLLRYNAMQVWRPEGFELDKDDPELLTLAKEDEELRTTGRNKLRKGKFRLYASYVAGMGNRHSVWSWVRTSKVVELILVYAGLATIIYVDDVITMVNQVMKCKAEGAVDEILDCLGFFRERTKTVAHDPNKTSSTLEVLGVGVTRTRSSIAFHPTPAKILKMTLRAERLFTLMTQAEQALAAGQKPPPIDHQTEVSTAVGMIAHVAQIQQTPAAGESIRDITQDLAPTPSLWVNTLNHRRPLRRMMDAVIQAVIGAATQRPTIFNLSPRKTAIIFDDASRCGKTGKVVLCSFLFTPTGNFAFSTELSQTIADTAFGNIGDMQDTLQDAHIGVGEAAAYSLATYFWNAVQGHAIQDARITRFQDNLGAEANAHKVGGKTPIERAFMAVAAEIIGSRAAFQLFGYVRSELNISDCGTAKSEEMVKLYKNVTRAVGAADLSHMTQIVQDWEHEVMKRFNKRRDIITTTFLAAVKTMHIQYEEQLHNALAGFDKNSISGLQKIHDMWDASAAANLILEDGASSWDTVTCTRPTKIRLLRFATAYSNLEEGASSAAPGTTLSKNDPGRRQPSDITVEHKPSRATATSIDRVERMKARHLWLPRDWRQSLEVTHRRIGSTETEKVETLPPEVAGRVPWSMSDEEIARATETPDISWEPVEITGATEANKKTESVILRQQSRKLSLPEGTLLFRNIVTGALVLPDDLEPSDVLVRGVHSCSALQMVDVTDDNLSYRLPPRDLSQILLESTRTPVVVTSSAEAVKSTFKAVASQTAQAEAFPTLHVSSSQPSDQSPPDHHEEPLTLVWSWKQGTSNRTIVLQVLPDFAASRSLKYGKQSDAAVTTSPLVAALREVSQQKGSCPLHLVVAPTTPRADAITKDIFLRVLAEHPTTKCNKIFTSKSFARERRRSWEMFSDGHAWSRPLIPQGLVETIILHDPQEDHFKALLEQCEQQIESKVGFRQLSPVFEEAALDLIPGPDQCQEHAFYVLTDTNIGVAWCSELEDMLLSKPRAKWLKRAGIASQQVQLKMAKAGDRRSASPGRKRRKVDSTR